MESTEGTGGKGFAIAERDKMMPEGKTTIVHCKKDDYDVFIGRPSIWGNPFKIGIHGTREEVIEKFKEYLQDKPHLIELAKEQLKGKVLGCYCNYPQQDCHGRIWIAIVDGEHNE